MRLCCDKLRFLAQGACLCCAIHKDNFILTCTRGFFTGLDMNIVGDSMYKADVCPTVVFQSMTVIAKFNFYGNNIVIFSLSL